MSWLADVTRVILDLVGEHDERTLQDRLAAAERVKRELSAESEDVELFVGELISAAEYSARGILPAARERLSALGILIQLSPTLGYLIFRVVAEDPERTGEAHDLLLRLLEQALSGAQPSSIPPAAIFPYDVAASARLADVLLPTGDLLDSLWRTEVLLALGRPEDAAEMLVQLFQDGREAVGEILARSAHHVSRCIHGRPELARRLLDSAIPRLQPHGSLDSVTLQSLFTLVDATDEDRALALVQRVAPDATDAVFYSWGAAASASELQRAAAHFACAGLAATGSHTCAELAVFRLAACNDARRAIEIALETDWAPEHPRLDLLFERCLQVAEDNGQLSRLVARAAVLGLEVARRHWALGGSDREEDLNAFAVFTLDRDGPGAALSFAQQTAFSEHRSPAALALWVDFHIELGRLDDAVAIAERLVGAWPEHPLPHLKVAQCLAWLDLRAETEAELRAAADRLPRFPRAAVEVLERLAGHDLAGARVRVASAIEDPAFATVAPGLRRLYDELAEGGRE